MWQTCQTKLNDTKSGGIISKTKSFFFELFAAFLKSILNFEHFEKKYDPHSFCISEITDSENVVR